MRIILTILLLTEAIRASVETNYDQRYSDKALEQRLCTSVVIGFDYLVYSMSKIQERYLRFYNDPLKFRYQREKYERFKQKE